jgi:hypothetical protein
MTMGKYRIVFWYDNWTPQPFIYDLGNEQEAIRVFHALLEHRDFLLAREICRGYLYKARPQEELAVYAALNNWVYPTEDDGEAYWVQWVSPDGFDIYDYLKTKTVRL